MRRRGEITEVRRRCEEARLEKKENRGGWRAREDKKEDKSSR